MKLEQDAKNFFLDLNPRLPTLGIWVTSCLICGPFLKKTKIENALRARVFEIETSCLA